MAWTHFLQQTTSLIPRGALKLHDDVSKAIKNGKKVSKQNDILFNTSAVFFSFSVFGIYWT